MAQSKRQTSESGWHEEKEDLLRGAAGGLIFGLPLLYTMEMWDLGVEVEPAQLLLISVAIFVLNFLFSLFSGMRKANENRHSMIEALSDTVTALGLAIILSVLVLGLTGQLDTNISYSKLGNRIILEALAISLGIIFTNIRFGQGQEQSEEEKSASKKKSNDVEGDQLKVDLLEAAATLAGAFVFSMNIAPTEEILKITSGLVPWQLIAMLVAQTGFVYLILFASRLGGTEDVVKNSFFQTPFSETVMCHASALGVSALLLWLVGFPGVSSTPQTFVACTIVLALPAAVGGAAGRLAV